MNDELKERTMEALHFTEEEYWENLSIYLDNLLASPSVLSQISNYIISHNPEFLDMEVEMRIAKDMFGGYKYGEH